MFSNHQKCKKTKLSYKTTHENVVCSVLEFHHLQEEFSSWEVSKIALPFFLGELRQQYRLYHHKNVDKTAPFIYQPKNWRWRKISFLIFTCKTFAPPADKIMFLRNFIFRQIIANKFFGGICHWRNLVSNLKLIDRLTNVSIIK